MGKARKARIAARRDGVLQRRNKPSKPEPTIKTVEGTIETLKQQLQLPNFEEKLCGLQTLGTLLEAEENLTTIMNQKVVRIVAPLLIDENSTVRNASAGTLRNFSSISLEACDYLVEQDVVTLLIAFFKKYDENWIPKITKTGHLDEDGDTFIQAVHLLWNLCESSEIPIKRIEESDVLSILVRCLNREQFGDELFVAVLHCIYVVMEDNTVAVNMIKDGCGDLVQKIIVDKSTEPVDLLIKTLSVGIFLNLHQNDLLNLPKEIVSKLFEILAETLSLNFKSGCHKISSFLPLLNENVEESNYQKNTDVQKQLVSLKYTADALQTAIETIANICSIEENTMDVDEPMESDSDVDLDEDDVEEMNCVNSSNVSENKIMVPEKICDFIKSSGLLDKLWQKVDPLAENVSSILDESSEGKQLLHKSNTIQSRAMLCLNNFVENLSLELLGGREGIYNIWTGVGKVVFKTTVNDYDILESGTTLIRVAFDRLKKEIQDSKNTEILDVLVKDITLTDIQVMFNRISQSEYPQIRVNLYRMMGDLGLLLMPKTSGASTIDIALSKFLLERMFKESDILILAELIDTIMDLFSEDESDELALNIKLIDNLIAIHSTLKSKARQHRKNVDNRDAVLNTVTGNFVRFLMYKKKRIDLIHDKERNIIH